MDKRRITAREILKDIRGGASDPDLMKKYALSAQGLQSVFTKLVNSGVVTQVELDDRVPVSERTVDLGLFICPACGNIQGKEFVTCPRCGFSAPQRSKQAAPAPAETAGKKTPAKTVIKALKTPTVTPIDREEPRGAIATPAARSIDDLGRTASFCRVLGIGVLVVYAFIVAGMFLLQMSSQGFSPTSVEFLAIALMGIPALVIAIVFFVVLKAMTESIKVFVEVTKSLPGNPPHG
jgi:hypothetical protein